MSSDRLIRFARAALEAANNLNVLTLDDRGELAFAIAHELEVCEELALIVVRDLTSKLKYRSPVLDRLITLAQAAGVL